MVYHMSGMGDAAQRGSRYSRWRFSASPDESPATAMKGGGSAGAAVPRRPGGGTIGRTEPPS